MIFKIFSSGLNLAVLGVKGLKKDTSSSDIISPLSLVAELVFIFYFVTVRLETCEVHLTNVFSFTMYGTFSYATNISPNTHQRTFGILRYFNTEREKV